MIDHETKVQTGIAGVKMTPAIGGAVWYSFTLQEWVAIVTIIYVVLQIGLLLPKYCKNFKEFFGNFRKKQEPENDNESV